MKHSAEEIHAFLENLDRQHISFVDFRFTDIHGVWHHTTYTRAALDLLSFTQGILFDGSSIQGWRSIHESDMIMRPDLSSAFLDPFSSDPTMVVICDIIDPLKDQAYDLDPRSIAQKAGEYLQKTQIADRAYFGPECEFFIFDQAEYAIHPYESYYRLRSEEMPASGGQMAPWHGHSQRAKQSYYPVAPLDQQQGLRAHMVKHLASIGLEPLLHHHEVAVSQAEIGFLFDTLLKTADNVQKYKYTVRNSALEHGKTATFMPKPIPSDNGSGMHVHISLWDKDNNLFSGQEYAELSQESLYFIGGIIHHAQALNAFTNPSTNSYRRLVPGFEAPCLLAYSACNRSAAIRIPHVLKAAGKRIEVRFPDAMANPYLAFSALLMAGIDGIQQKRDPGEAMHRNLYELPADLLAGIPTVAYSLHDALSALDSDRAFLTQGQVFSNAFIDQYIALKQEEVQAVYKHTPPLEFSLYFSR